MSKNIYVLSDLHGHFDIFIQMLKRLILMTMMNYIF